MRGSAAGGQGGRAAEGQGGRRSSSPCKFLFICSRNRIRSLTAERLFVGRRDVLACSSGTSVQARVRVTAGHLGWADVIFVMERRHRDLLRRRFGAALTAKEIVCLDIPDEYAVGEDALVELLVVRLSPFVDLSDQG